MVIDSARVIPKTLTLFSYHKYMRTYFLPTTLKHILPIFMFLVPWRRKWQPTPVFLSGKSHGQRNLVGCSPWGRDESDMTEHAWPCFLSI